MAKTKMPTPITKLYQAPYRGRSETPTNDYVRYRFTEEIAFSIYRASDFKRLGYTDSMEFERLDKIPLGDRPPRILNGELNIDIDVWPETYPLLHALCLACLDDPNDWPALIDHLIDLELI